jgi:hypothetical protein
MRLLRSPLFPPLLIVALLANLTGAGWASTWALSVSLWLLSAVIAAVMFAVLLRDPQ